VTSDTDLVPAIKATQDVGVRVLVTTPPARDEEHLSAVADAYLRVGRRHLKYSPLPSLTIRPDTNHPLRPPDAWMLPEDW
jgi:hypothetical protein